MGQSPTDGLSDRDPRWSRLEPDERRRQILDCARRLFSERGYAAVSTEEIAQAAGVRRGLLNHYFGTKRDLFLEVVGELLSTAPLWSLGQDLPEEDLVSVSVREWLDLVESNGDMWFAVLGAEGFGRDAELEQMLDDAREAAIQRVIDVLQMPDVDNAVRAVLRSYGALAEETSRQWLLRSRLTRAGAHALLTETLLAMLRDVTPVVRAAESRHGAPSPERT